MQMDTTSKKLIDFTLGLKFKDLDTKAIDAAKQRIISTFGVALGAFKALPVEIARSIAQPVAAGPAASLLGTKLPVRLQWQLSMEGLHPQHSKGSSTKTEMYSNLCSVSR